MKEFKGQLEMFKYIWLHREHKSELTGEFLLPPGHSQWHFQFLHVLPKGSFPYYKLNPDNILLGLPYEHEHQEQYKVFNDKKLALTRAYYKEFYGKAYDED